MALEGIGVEMIARGSEAFFRAMERGDRSVDLFGKTIGGVATSTSKAFAKMADGAQERIGHMVADGFVNAGLAVARFIGGSVEAAGKFQATMNKFSSVAGGSLRESGRDIQQFSGLFMQMGADTAFSSQQAGDAAIELAKGGRSASQVFNELGDSLALAAAGEVSLAEAAELSAKQLGIWEDTGVTSKKVADLLSQAANASVVGVKDLGIGLANVGGVAKIAGLSFEETVTALAQIAPGFSSASDAGTSFKAFLNNLQPTTDPATQAMEELGLMTEQGTSKFYDAAGSFIGMGAASELLHDATKNLSEAERSLALETIFGSDAQRAAAIIAEDGEKGFRDMAESMGKAGSATDQAAERNQGYVYAMDQLTGSLETFQIALGEKVLPAITALISTGAGLINFVTEAVKGFDGLEPIIIGVGVATLVYATVQLPAMIGGLALAIPLLIKQAAAFTASLGPIGWVALAIGGVAAAWTNYQNKIEAATDKTLASKKFWISSTDALKLYEEQSKDVQAEVRREAEALEKNRLALEAEMESLGQRMTMDPARDWSQEIDALNVKAQAIKDTEKALRTEIKAYEDGKPIIRESIGQSYAAQGGFRAAAEGAGELGRQAEVSKEQLQKLTEELDKINNDAVKALDATQQTQLTWLEGSEQRYDEHIATLSRLNKEYRAESDGDQQARIAEQIAAEQTSYAQQNHDANVFYATQRAAQQAAYGEQLIAYIQNQRDMGHIGKTEAAALIGEVTKQYGVAADASVLLWDQQKADIARWAAGSKQSAGEFIGSMQDSQTAATNFEQEFNRRVDSAIARMEVMGLEGEELDRALGSIRSEVRTKMILEGFGEASRTALETGYAISQGLATGVANGRGLVAAAVTDTIAAAYAAGRGYAGIASPSKLFADGIGMEVSKGIGWGIDMGMPEAVDSLVDGLAWMTDTGLRGIDRMGTLFAQATAHAAPSGWSWDSAAVFGGEGGVIGNGGGGGGWGGMSTVTPPATPSQIMQSTQNSYDHSRHVNYSATYHNTPPAPDRDSAHAAALANIP